VYNKARWSTVANEGCLYLLKWNIDLCKSLTLFLRDVILYLAISSVRKPRVLNLLSSHRSTLSFHRQSFHKMFIKFTSNSVLRSHFHKTASASEVCLIEKTVVAISSWWRYLEPVVRYARSAVCWRLIMGAPTWGQARMSAYRVHVFAQRSATSLARMFK
jgi:hypothetical protein